MKDKRDSVKIKAIESSIGIIELFRDQKLIDGFMDLIKKADEKKMSWRVRYALGESLCHFAKYLPVEIVRTDILNIYLEYLKDKEQEIRSISVSSLPVFCQYLQQKDIDKIVENLKQVAADESNHVKLSLTESIFDISKQSTVEKALEGVLEIIKILLKDTDTQVRLKLLEGL